MTLKAIPTIDKKTKTVKQLRDLANSIESGELPIQDFIFTGTWTTEYDTEKFWWLFSDMKVMEVAGLLDVIKTLILDDAFYGEQ